MWQPSLVLGSLGRARWVPIAFSGSNLGLRHSTPTKAKILAHSLEVSKKKVTSVSDTIIVTLFGRTRNEIMKMLARDKHSSLFFHL